MRCNVCQTENDEYARFCTQCGHELGQPASGGPALPPVAPSGGADPLWAQTVGTDPGGPRWTEPIPIDELPSQNSESANAEPPPALTTPTQSQPRTMPTIADVAVVRPADFATAQAELRMTVAAELAARRRRRKALLMSLGAIVVLIGAVVAIALATAGDNGSVATDTTGLAVETTIAIPETTVFPATTLATATTVTPSTAVAATTVAPTTVVAATVVAGTVVATTITPTTVPTSASTVPVTAPLTTPPTATTVVPATTATTSAPPTSGVAPGNGDLGLDRPISKPACDGQFITLIGSSVDSDGYAIQVKSILDRYPAAKYLRTELVCSSLRAKSAAGDPIYVVFFGPFASKQQACDARRDGTDGAYVKTLDNTSNPGAGVNCSS